ncbi:hypothetical protein [uncultured Tenacibaculum sp.]|uniref:hypothetical protein n=1 Tax=uncultured Tenacibaculum sp. TaxID=174713 RepID=UPI002607311A|nr:hypothetical protein [uncultured Tenacibaculum sp.]
MIEKLIEYENDELDSWYETSVEYSDNFMKEFVIYADNNKDKVLNYALNSEPSFISSHNIIFEALSTFSTNWSDFLFNEAQRIMGIVENEPEKYRILEVISDSFDVDNIYDNDFIFFEKLINSLFEYYYNSKNKKVKRETLFVLHDLLTEAGEDHKTLRWWYQMDTIDAECIAERLNKT